MPKRSSSAHAPSPSQRGTSRYQSQTVGFLGFLRNWHGRYEEALALSSEGIQAGREHPQLLAVLTRNLLTQGVARTGLGNYDAGLQALEEGLQLCEKLDNELEINRLLNTLGMVYMQCGAFDAGLAFSTRGLEIARRSSHATGFERVAFNLVDQADGFLSRGDLALAADVLDEAVHIVQHPPESRWMTWRYETHCWVSLGELCAGPGRRRAGGAPCEPGPGDRGSHAVAQVREPCLAPQGRRRPPAPGAR